MTPEKLIIIECGFKRVAKKCVCEYCKKDFLVSKRKQGKFCSKTCFRDSKSLDNKIPNVVCSTCNKPFYKSPSNMNQVKHGFHFCCRGCKDKAQRLEGGIIDIMPPHYGTGIVKNYRDKFNNSEFVCRRCGYKEFSCSVDIHHIDKNRENNSIDNLIPLCSNCHRSLHNKQWELSELSMIEKKDE